ncbi:hypothetical protein HPB50_001211 [Hyalomma asiaticum]|uniref:Uncharacterized protein n=1 Tax=Hyalomma asiaticum TaxID=266040 RepID=A0ACB7SAU9_HYAAI|nr:hypothetical protein HPB50_001211 [Hyalomma asiaticum]
MAVVLYCGFKAIEDIETYFRAPTLEKGRRLYGNSHVYGVKEVDGGEISAKCLSQQSKHAYDVELHLSITPRQIVGGRCSCRYGALGDCKHCAAVAFYINLHVDASCTSGPPSWVRPSSKPNHDDKVPLKKLFGGMTLMLAGPPLHMLRAAGLFPKLSVARRDYLQEIKPEERDYYNTCIVCESVKELCVLTAGQSNCPRWHKERKVRVSSTSAHTILRTRRGPEAILRSLLNDNFFSSVATAYGMRMEPVAREEFEKQHGVTVTEGP